MWIRISMHNLTYSVLKLSLMAMPEALRKGNPCCSQWTREEHLNNAVLLARTHGCGCNEIKARGILLTTVLQAACMAVHVGGSNEMRAKMPDWCFSIKQTSPCSLRNTLVLCWTCLPDLICSSFLSLGVSEDVSVDHSKGFWCTAPSGEDCSRSCPPALWLTMHIYKREKATEHSSHQTAAFAVPLHMCVTWPRESVLQPGLSRTCMDMVHL